MHLGSAHEGPSYKPSLLGDPLQTDKPIKKTETKEDGGDLRKNLTTSLAKRVIPGPAYYCSPFGKVRVSDLRPRRQTWSGEYS